jgi:hypothetical protein
MYVTAVRSVRRTVDVFSSYLNPPGKCQDSALKFATTIYAGIPRTGFFTYSLQISALMCLLFKNTFRKHLTVSSMYYSGTNVVIHELPTI